MESIGSIVDRLEAAVARLKVRLCHMEAGQLSSLEFALRPARAQNCFCSSLTHR